MLHRVPAPLLAPQQGGGEEKGAASPLPPSPGAGSPHSGTVNQAGFVWLQGPAFSPGCSPMTLAQGLAVV